MAQLVKWSVCAGGHHYTLEYDDGSIVKATYDDLLEQAKVAQVTLDIAGSRTKADLDTKLTAIAKPEISSDARDDIGIPV